MPPTGSTRRLAFRASLGCTPPTWVFQGRKTSSGLNRRRDSFAIPVHLLEEVLRTMTIRGSHIFPLCWATYVGNDHLHRRGAKG